MRSINGICFFHTRNSDGIYLAVNYRFSVFPLSKKITMAWQKVQHQRSLGNREIGYQSKGENGLKSKSLFIGKVSIRETSTRSRVEDRRSHGRWLSVFKKKKTRARNDERHVSVGKIWRAKTRGIRLHVIWTSSVCAKRTRESKWKIIIVIKVKIILFNRVSRSVGLVSEWKIRRLVGLIDLVNRIWRRAIGYLSLSPSLSFRI